MPSRPKVLDQRLDLALGTRVQAGGGFVEEQDVGLHRPGARQRQPLLLPARQGARRRAARPAGPPAAARSHPLRALGGRHAGQPQGQLQVAPHRQVQQEGALEQHRRAWAGGRPAGQCRGPGGAAGHAAGAAAWSCPSRWRRPGPGGRRGAASATHRAAPGRRSARRPRAVVSAAAARRAAGRRSRHPPGPRAVRSSPCRLPRRQQTRLIRPPRPAAPRPAPAPAAGRPCWFPARWRWSSRGSRRRCCRPRSSPRRPRRPRGRRP
jgi:hypothetical protein